MEKRFLSLWFRHLVTDRQTLRRPELKDVPFVFAAPDRGRNVVTATNILAEKQGISVGMSVADCRAIITDLEVLDDVLGQDARLLNTLGEWCIRYSPLIAVNMPDGLMLDITGCTHLWGGERNYLKEIINRLREKGYDVRGAIADTIGAAWAVARYGRLKPIIGSNEQLKALADLPPVALRLEPLSLERLHKLGFYTIKSFIDIGRSALRRRFGDAFLLRIDQALGTVDEPMQLLHPIDPYTVRLPSMEPICTADGIAIAISTLLTQLCERLQAEGKGLRTAELKCYRVDGQLIKVSIGTHTALHRVERLFKLFELKISTIEPALGIELFVMEATKTEDAAVDQEVLWSPVGSVSDDQELAGLLDRINNKISGANIRRYLPQEHYWPERSIKATTDLKEGPATSWDVGRLRPTLLLDRPEEIQVASVLPDYPPIFFIYQNHRHNIKRADGPERIEREWWLDGAGPHRDYYTVEDEEGRRYWVFRSGHYNEEFSAWFLHGFFA